MEKKTECEIVQDLLLSYVDDILNVESKKFVEKHLLECDKCKNRLEDIKTDIKENGDTQKKEIDYLKRIRRKSLIKSIFIAISIIISLIFIFYLNKFIIINKIINKAEETLKSNNIYKETRQEMADGSVSIKEEYYKDGKYKSVWKIYSDEGMDEKIVTYANLNSDERITLYNNKTGTVEKGNITKLMNSESSLKFVPFIKKENLFSRIGKTFLMSIDTYTYEDECYCLKYQYEKPQKWEIWIDKKTYLPIKQINRNSEKTFFQGTDVVKDIRDTTQNYKYEFGIVTEEDVQVPDISDYEIEYFNRNIEDVRNQ